MKPIAYLEEAWAFGEESIWTEFPVCKSSWDEHKEIDREAAVSKKKKNLMSEGDCERRYKELFEKKVQNTATVNVTRETASFDHK